MANDVISVSDAPGPVALRKASRAPVAAPSRGLQDAVELMSGFARRTGLVGSGPQHRCLWTDAHAAMNFLALAQRVHQPHYLSLALRLIDRVHHVLGHWRPGSERHGWLSGLEGAEAEAHPTIRGLRIGKPLPERRPGEPADAVQEWQRDGQYFHCLTKWMQVLHLTARVTGQEHYDRWARELARVAVARFLRRPAGGGRARLVWKMSADLSRPLVITPGQHDPVDGLLTIAELNEDLPGADLRHELTVLSGLVRPARLATGDPLGVGQLLLAANRAARLLGKEPTIDEPLLVALLQAAWDGLAQVRTSRILEWPPAERVPSREMALAAGLRAVDQLRSSRPEGFESGELNSLLEWLAPYRALARTIEEFWAQPEHRWHAGWLANRDVNDVFFAGSLLPRGVLGQLT